MEIDYLANHPRFVETLARWHQAEWAHLNPARTVEQRIEKLQAQLAGCRQIPTTFVALAQNQPAGSASLVVHDMDTRTDLSPWLASVYVAPEHRMRGIGTSLVQRVTEEARALGTPILYLFTTDRESFYARQGWRVIERTQYHNYPVVLMSIAPA